MSQPYVGEIRALGFQFAPSQWAFCNGQPMPISQFDTLYSLIGTIYGGDGVNTFNLPNLQGQVPMHWGTGISGQTTSIGQTQGVTLVTLTQAQTPQHTHTITAQEVAAGGVWRRPRPQAQILGFPTPTSPGFTTIRRRSIRRLPATRLRPWAARSRTTICSPIWR